MGSNERAKKERQRVTVEFHRMTEEEKYIVAEWKYDGDYAIYNNESYDVQKEKGFGFANPKTIFYTFYEDNNIIGFTNLYEEETEVFFGIGVNPICCGRGYGYELTKKTIRLSHEMFPDKPLYLEVRTWNKRAVKCYEKAGFHIVGEPIVQSTHIGDGEFFHMVAD